jgi:hypothetical protein
MAEQVGTSGPEQLPHLFGFDCLLQDDQYPSGSHSSWPSLRTSRKHRPFRARRPERRTLGKPPSASLAEKSTSSLTRSSPSLDCPKSNSGAFSALSWIRALKGRPILLRKPVSGPTLRSREQELSISLASNCRPATIFQRAKSQAWHWNFL